MPEKLNFSSNDPDEILRYLRTTFIACDNTNMCRQVLLPEQQAAEKYDSYFPKLDGDSSHASSKSNLVNQYFSKASQEFLNKCMEEDFDMFISSEASLSDASVGNSEDEATGSSFPKNLETPHKKSTKPRQKVKDLKKVRSETQLRIKQG